MEAQSCFVEVLVSIERLVTWTKDYSQLIGTMPKFSNPFLLLKDTEMHNHHCQVLFSFLHYLKDTQMEFS